MSETSTAFDPEKVSRYYNGHNELKNCATNEPMFMESNPDTIMVQAGDYDKLLELYRAFFLSQSDLQIIKEALEHKWEQYRPEGDEAALYERILKLL